MSQNKQANPKQLDIYKVKKSIAEQLTTILKQDQIAKIELSRRMNTSQIAIYRLLKPKKTGTTLATLVNAANALGKKITILIE